MICKHLLLFVIAWILPTTSTILLNKTNHLLIHGPIDANVASNFVYESQLHFNRIRYVYIYSPGGDVRAGEQIVEELQLRNYTCIADQAYSMAFVLLQACPRRLVRPSASLMQHQISLTRVIGNLGTIQSLLQDVERMKNRLIALQAKRIGVSPEWLINKTTNDWWMDAKEAVRSGCADRIEPMIRCSVKLTATRISRIETDLSELFAIAHVKEYSACPLVHRPLQTVASASVNISRGTQ